MEKIYEATIKNAETNELLVKVSSYSQEGLEEEMGKDKFTKFAGEEPQEDLDELDRCRENDRISKGG